MSATCFLFYIAINILARGQQVDANPPLIGPFETANKVYSVPALDRSDPHAHLVYPVSNDSSLQFPLVTYLHGVLGGSIDLLGYVEQFHQIASYGFVVAASFSCNTGCKENTSSPWTSCAGLLPLQPEGKGWSPYYGEHFKMISWAQNESASPDSDPVFRSIDWASGVGIAGHSMGGQATAVASCAACAKQWNIKAAVLHHPASGDVPSGNIGSNISIPAALFTSSGDTIWPQTEAIMKANTFLPTAYRDEVGWSHLEPVLWPPIPENPLLATFTAAWFKVILNRDTGYYYDLIFRNTTDSLCNSAPMVDCFVTPALNRPPM